MRSSISNITTCIAVAICSLLMIGCGKSEDVSGQSEIAKPSELNAQAVNQLSVDSIDAAIELFATSGSLIDVADGREERKEAVIALNSLAYLYQTQRNDMSASFKYLSRAKDACGKYGFDGLLAQVYANYASLLIKHEPKLALNYYRDSFQIAMRTNQREIANSSLPIMIALATSQRKLSELDDEIYVYLSEPEEDKWLESISVSMAQAAESIIKQDTVGALSILSSALPDASPEHVKYKIPDQYSHLPGIMKLEILRQSGDKKECSMLCKILIQDMRDSKLLNPTTKLGLIQNYERVMLELGEKTEARRLKAERLELADSLETEKKLFEFKEAERQYNLDKKSAEFTEYRQRQELRQWLLVGGLVVCIIIVLSLASALFFRRENLRMRHWIFKKSAAKENVGEPKIEGESDNPELDDNEMQSRREMADILELTEKQIFETGLIFKSGLTIADIAEAVDIKVRDLSRAINNVENVNFNTWLSKLRVNEAKKRLASSEYSQLTTEAVGESVGFKSRSNFTTIFRQETGLTPSQYRREAAKTR